SRQARAKPAGQTGEGGSTEISKSTPCKAIFSPRPIVYSPDTLARAFIARIKPEISRRRAIASAMYRPYLNSFLFAFGAPVGIPTCIRHRPFGIAGARHDFRFRVRAPHRGLRCMGNLLRIGLSLWFR